MAINRITGCDESGAVNVVALVKDSGEQYIWSYRDDQESDVLRSFGRFAVAENLSFTWYDAAVMSQKVRQQKRAPGG